MNFPRITLNIIVPVAGLILFAGSYHTKTAAAATDETQPYQVPTMPVPVQPPTQPVNFSHALHTGSLNLPCATCHVGANAGSENDPRTAGGKHMTLPEASTCMTCHQVVATDRPAIQQLAEYANTGEAIEWMRVYSVLKGVNWSHQPHLNAGIDCQACHGDVTQLGVMSMATAVTAMTSCISCHRAREANSQCETCHAWPSAEQMHQWNDL